MKTCSRCKAEKPTTDFSKDARRKSGLQPRCKACNAEYYAQNRERIRLRREQEKENIYARHKEYRERNADKLREARANNEARKQYLREYKRNNRAQYAEYEHRRRARKYGSVAEPLDPAVIFARDEGVCHLCRLAVDPDNWHQEHVIPLSKGGTHTYDNVRVAHPACNLRKGVRIL